MSYVYKTCQDRTFFENTEQRIFFQLLLTRTDHKGFISQYGIIHI